jgi:predicted dehydrogenase
MRMGHESWHPNPAFYYQAGGGPLFDMGPYYLTALVNLLGPVRRVTGSARISFLERTVTSAPLAGTRIKVEVPTHVAGVLDFTGGAVASVIASFDVWSHGLSTLEVYGTEGSLYMPEAGCVTGEVVYARRARESEWSRVVPFRGYSTERGMGVADMAYALRTGREHRASGEFGLHVLDIMQGLHESSERGEHVTLASTCARPAPLPEGLPAGELGR